MKKQSYQERVQALAQKMGLVKYADTLEIYSHISENEYLKRKKEAIELMLPAARIAVADTAEAVRKAFRRVRHWVSVTDEWIEIYLKEQGLIPDDGQGVNPVFDPKGSVHNPDNPPSLPSVRSIEIALEKAYPKDGPEFVGNMYDIFSAGYMAGLNAQEDGQEQKTDQSDAYGGLGRELDDPTNPDRWETFSNI